MSNLQDNDWEAKEIRRRIDEQKARSIPVLIERAFAAGYLSRPNHVDSIVEDIADGHMKEAWERWKPELLPTESPSSIEGEEKVQECKSPDGLVVGLIDSLIAISNVLTTDDFLYRDGVWDALADLRASDNMKRLMNIGELEDAKAYIKEKQKEIDVLSTALSELSGQFKKGAITISFIKWLEENCSMEDGIWYYQKYPDNRDNWTDTAALYKMFLSESTSLPIKEEEKTIEWDSERLIGCVHGRFNQLIEKEWDWRSFYGGWMEGRVDIFATIKGLKYPVSENTPKAAPIEQEKKDKL